MSTPQLERPTATVPNSLVRTLPTYCTSVPLSVRSEFGIAATRRSSCGADAVHVLVRALGTRTVREPLCDCTVLVVGRARSGHRRLSESVTRDRYDIHLKY